MIHEHHGYTVEEIEDIVIDSHPRSDVDTAVQCLHAALEHRQEFNMTEKLLVNLAISCLEAIER
jgi:hypothetical protein